MPNETQSEIANPMGYVTREDARKLEAGIADCMLIMRDQTGRFERPVYARPEKKGSELKGFGCPVPTSADRAGRIYVAGPMSGIAEFNFPVFNAAAAILRCQGWVVENPAEHSLAEGLEWADYMAYDLTRLGLCGAIYMLPGWSKSKGATIEKNLAEALGMNIKFDPNAEQAIDTAPTLPSGEQMEFDRLAHEQVIAVCRTAAFNCSEQHSYMAGLKNDYKNWFPHKWVIDAMRALIGVNQSTCSDLRAHVTRLQAENAALQQRLNVADQQNDELKSKLAKVVPEGYCVMPRRLTAENGAKALLLGEFKVAFTRECPECAELEEPTEGCEVCDGEGKFAMHQLISWDKINFIYSSAVAGLALKPETETTTPQ